MNQDPDCLNATHYIDEIEDANLSPCLKVLQSHFEWGPSCYQSSFSPECVLQHFQLDLEALIANCKHYPVSTVTDNATLQSMIVNDTCHEAIGDFNQWVVSSAQFWLEGVAIIVVGIFGMAGNALTVLVLRRIETNVMFNKLLMSLGIFIFFFFIFEIKSCCLGCLY